MFTLYLKKLGACLAAVAILIGGGMLLALVVAGAAMLLRRNGQDNHEPTEAGADRASWRMPPLSRLSPARLTLTKRIWLGVLRCYLVAATIMVIVRVMQIALGQG